MSATLKAIIMRSGWRAACSYTESMRSSVWRAKWPWLVSGSTQMEKNSAPRFPALALSRLMWPRVFWIGRSDVVVFVEEALRSIGVCVDDDGGVLDLAGFLADCLRMYGDETG